MQELIRLATYRGADGDFSKGAGSDQPRQLPGEVHRAVRGVAIAPAPCLPFCFTSQAHHGLALSVCMHVTACERNASAALQPQIGRASCRERVS